MKKKSTNAAIYTRLSEDRTGDKDGDARQLADCETAAERLGFDVVERYSDLESAYRKGARRADFERALDDFRAGKYGTLIVWRADRIARASRDWAKVMPMIDDDGLRIVGASDGVDTSTDAGRLMLGYSAEGARSEAKTMATRIKSASDQRAREGRFHGGRHRPFGHERDGSLVESEAELVRLAAERLLAGESHYVIVKDWDALGVTTTDGNSWTLRSFKLLMQQARLAGAREVDGALVSTGAIAPILSVETLLALRLHFNSKRGSVRRASRVLSGLVVCGNCGERMSVHGSNYYCMKKSTGNAQRGCGKVGISARLLEEHVEPRLLAMLRAVELDDDDDTLPELEAELVKFDERAARLSTLWALGEIDEPEWRVAGETIRERREHLRSLLARRRATAASTSFASEWDGLTLEQRRAVALNAGLRVTVSPAVRPGPRWQPDRIKLALASERA